MKNISIEDLKEEIEVLKGYKHMYKKLLEQNKRYREAIEEAIKDLENECLWDALVALKALECEE